MFGGYFENKKKAFWVYLQSWQSAVYSTIVLAATMVVIFWASVFLYTSFYFTFMPQESVTWPIHFQYKSCVDVPGLCSNPKGVVAVTDPSRGSVLVRGQRYRVVVDMEMPESPTNQRIGNGDRLRPPGMFLISMDMRKQDGSTLRHASRSSMLRYKSPLLHFISTFVFAPFLLYGIQEEKQIVTVELFSQYEEDPLTPLWEVGVELESRHVELYGATLRIHATFSGLRYIMYHFPLVAATIGIGICMVFLSAVVILSWYQFSGPALFVQREVDRFPHSRTPTVRPSAAQPTTPASTKKPEEEVIKSASSGDGTGTGSTGSPSGSIGSPSTSIGSRPDREPTDRDGEEDTSSTGSADREKSEGDDFEVLSSSKANEESERMGGKYRDGSDGVVRHRVQNVVS